MQSAGETARKRVNGNDDFSPPTYLLAIYLNPRISCSVQRQCSAPVFQSMILDVTDALQFYLANRVLSNVPRTKLCLVRGMTNV